MLALLFFLLKFTSAKAVNEFGYQGLLRKLNVLISHIVILEARMY